MISENRSGPANYPFHLVKFRTGHQSAEKPDYNRCGPGRTYSKLGNGLEMVLGVDVFFTS